MDYEKKYNDALNLAKSYYGNGCNEFLDTIFPELRESEDERIRRKMIEHFKAKTKETWCNIPVKDIIAYLEKQKESLHDSEMCKENADSFTDACKDVIVAIEKYLDWLTGYPDYAPKGKYSIRDMLHCLYVLEKQKEQKPPIAGNDFGWIDELKHDLKHPEELDEKVQEVLKKRQKPVERSLEDDHIIGFVYDLLNEIEWKDNWAMSKEECLERLKSLRPPLKDKEMKLKILKYLSTRCSSLEFEEVEDYLNNLRPSWKPSEEQMAALNALNCHGDLSYVGQQKQLISLYNDLKKLM